MKKRGGIAVSGIMAALVVVVLGIGLIAEGPAAGEGIRRGLSLCGEVLIPALFPFMALSCWMSRSDAARIISLPLAPLTRYVFRLRQDLGATVLLSAIGGYPVGAKMISLLLAKNKIEPKTAERMLCFCYGGSPSFLISAVGVGMLLSKKLGVMLYFSQILGTLLVGMTFSLRAPRPLRQRIPPHKNEGAAGFVHAVNDASTAMLTMCGWTILLSGLLSLLFATHLTSWLAERLPVGENFIQAALAGVLEVTSGCLYAARLGGKTALLLICIITSFGGLSVIFQVMACLGEDIRFGAFLFGRVLHAIFSSVIFMAAVNLWGNDVIPVMLPGGVLIPETAERPWLAWGCILVMCTMLLVGYRPEGMQKSVDRGARPKLQ